LKSLLYWVIICYLNEPVAVLRDIIIAYKSLAFKVEDCLFTVKLWFIEIRLVAGPFNIQIRSDPDPKDNIFVKFVGSENPEAISIKYYHMLFLLSSTLLRF
jgi:hypothetical protein